MGMVAMNQYGPSQYQMQNQGVSSTSSQVFEALLPSEPVTVDSDEVPSGDVISQDPPTGPLTKGDEVSLVSSKGPVLVTVPNVRAMGISAARDALTEAGFKVKTTKASGYLGLGYVLCQYRV